MIHYLLAQYRAPIFIPIYQSRSYGNSGPMPVWGAWLIAVSLVACALLLVEPMRDDWLGWPTRIAIGLFVAVLLAGAVAVVVIA